MCMLHVAASHCDTICPQCACYCCACPGGTCWIMLLWFACPTLEWQGMVAVTSKPSNTPS